MTALLILLTLGAYVALAVLLGRRLRDARYALEQVTRTAATQAWRTRLHRDSDREEIARLRAQLAEVARKSAGKNGEAST